MTGRMLIYVVASVSACHLWSQQYVLRRHQPQHILLCQSLLVRNAVSLAGSCHLP